MKFVRNGLLTLLFSMTMVSANAQDNLEYLMEVGAGAGMVSYEGDFNGSILRNMQPMGAVLWRYTFNPRMAIRTMGSYGKIKGSSVNIKTYYPELHDNPYRFNNTLGDLSVTFEYNFWPYGTGKDYRGAQRLTPFIFAGIGGTLVSGSEENVFTGNFPLGLGAKYKIGDRLNLGIEWAMHFSLSDKLDGKTDPYQIKSSGLFKNTDCYSALAITLTYSFKAKCKTCNNDKML